MSDALAASIVAALSPEPAPASPQPAATPSEPPSPPASPSPLSGEDFSGKTFTFNLRDALIDLNFSVTPDVDAATFAVMACVAISAEGRVIIATSQPENVRTFDEAQEALRARRLALDAIGSKTN